MAEHPPSRTRLTAVVHGEVQGVGFRYATAREARRLGLTGSATNRPDGTVEVVAQGTRHDCEELLQWLRGPATPGQVQSVDLAWEDSEWADSDRADEGTYTGPRGGRDARGFRTG